MNSMLRLIKRPSIVACKTRSRKMCSGHNPKGWVGHGEARGSKTAFLFTKPSTNVDIIKLLKVGGPSLAQIDNPENGPSFGKWKKTSVTLHTHTHTCMHLNRSLFFLCGCSFISNPFRWC